MSFLLHKQAKSWSFFWNFLFKNWNEFLEQNEAKSGSTVKKCIINSSEMSEKVWAIKVLFLVILDIQIKYCVGDDSQLISYGFAVS